MLNQQDCLSAGIDYNQGVARFVGAADLYEKFLVEFLSDTTYAELEKAMAAGDIHASFLAGHTLKGLTGNLSLNALYQCLVKFVDALRGDGDLPLAEKLYPDVQREYRTASEFIRSHLLAG